ncbi:MAG: hypothetical protein OXU69_07530 [Gemmatimonadota bacterium]|nr:hypothetical protein [Gemmatimonadota bacterium]MDE2984543.1 hypothetical protein [Gemmatimonadota bacterium]
MATFYRQQPIEIQYQPGEIPERKPPIENLWFDADDRLWVRLRGEDGDSLTRAHVYSAAGEFLFHAAWPREVSLEHGVIRGDVAIGFATDEFDVPEHREDGVRAGVILKMPCPGGPFPANP